MTFCALLAVGLALLAPPSPRAETADLILYNGKIITVDSRNHIEEALAARGSIILKVGGNREIKALAGPGCRLIDLKGHTATPGLIDSHYHVIYYGLQYWPGFLDIRFPTVQTKSDLLRIVGAKAQSLKPGEWISANQGFHIRPNETLDRWDLDKVAPQNPAYLRHGSGQFAVVNSAALSVAGITRATKDPQSSKILRDKTGEPTGVLSHYPAENLVARFAPGYGDRTEAEIFESIERGQQLCLKAGYTSAQDVIVSNVNDVRAYIKFAEAGRLKIRLAVMLYVNNEVQARKLVQAAPTLRSDQIDFRGWKLALDGGAGAGTALMYDRSLPASRLAYPYFSQDEFNRIVRLLHDTGLQVAVHVGGDQGIDMTVTAFEEAMKANPRPDPRHRIEHGLFPTPTALDRIGKAGIVISTSPQWISWHGEVYRAEAGDRAMRTFIPLRSILRKRIPLAFGCDVPASIYQEPKYAFLGAVTRMSRGEPQNPDERITIQEALRAHTMGSAYAGFAEKRTGSLEPGKLADIVVWNRDLYTVRPAELRDLEPVMTIVGGQVLYQAGK